MRRLCCSLAALLAASCGSTDDLQKATLPPPDAGPIVISVLVELPAMYKGMPLTVSGPNTPKSVMSPFDQQPAWEYQLSEQEFESATIEIIIYNPGNSEGQAVGSVSPVQPATMLCAGHGEPMTVAYQMTTTDALTGNTIPPQPKELQVICEDGTTTSMTY